MLDSHDTNDIGGSGAIPAITHWQWVLFDWGDTLMRDAPGQGGPMADWPQVRAMPGASDLLAWLSSRVHIGLTSNAGESDRADIRRALARVGLDTAIEAVFCQRDLGLGKHSPGFWTMVCKRIGVDAAAVLHIGNSLDSDVAAPARAGLDAIWVCGNGDAGSQNSIWQVPDLMALMHHWQRCASQV